ncbi:MAG: hypothetical protein U9N85_12030 [Bacteroidota bacterium]|nr:hypothetical protein [Bacteroidota bacterium]
MKGNHFKLKIFVLIGIFLFAFAGTNAQTKKDAKPQNPLANFDYTIAGLD